MTVPTSPRSGGGLRYKRFGVDIYPHPYFDPSSEYIPRSIKELYRWTRYLFLTNSTIGPIIRKKAAYIITDLIYETTNVGVKDRWKKLLERTLKYKEFLFKMLLDFEVYGSAFCSIIYPFERYLTCPHCKHKNLMKSVSWEYSGWNFVATCQNCHARTAMAVDDKPIRNRSRIRLQRWFPHYIDVKRNPITGNMQYQMRIPDWLRTRVSDPKQNRVYVEDTPIEILTAIKERKAIKFDPDNVYHMSYETVSHEEEGLGIPPILNIIKDAWLYQTYRRAQEAIALDHILPMTMVTPAATSGGISPHQMTDLRSWQAKIQQYITQWRRDQNSIFTVPFPMQVSQIRGDAQALNVHNDLQLSRQQIAGGLDVPADFLYGGLTWTGGNVTLRVLENLLINRLSSCNSFLEDWLVPRLSRFLRLPPIKIRHADFKMADDVQQKQIALGLRQTNTISDQTVIEEMDFDYAKEEKRKKEELDKRLAEMEKTQVFQARLQSRIALINAETQIKIQEMQAQFAQQQAAQQGQVDPMTGQPVPPDQMQPMQPGMQPGMQPQQPVQQEPAQTASSVMLPTPEMLSIWADNFLRTTPYHEREAALAVLKSTDPILARAVEARIRAIDQTMGAMEPLPEQKPPRRGPGKAVI